MKQVYSIRQWESAMRQNNAKNPQSFDQVYGIISLHIITPLQYIAHFPINQATPI